MQVFINRKVRVPGFSQFEPVEVGFGVSENDIPAELSEADVERDRPLPQIKLDKDETEDAGFIKIDILSNRGLAQWSDCKIGRAHV